MYTETDLKSIQSQLKKRSLALLAPVAVLLALFIYAYTLHLHRNESLAWLCYLSLLLLALLVIFCDSLFLSPLRAYKRHLKDALYGRTRELKGLFKSLDSTPCLRDNVAFYPLIISEGDLNNEEDDRLFYFDATKPFPLLSVGTGVTVISNDKRVSNLIV